VILYLDTSALVKLVIAEAGSEEVFSWEQEADVVATSRITLPEALGVLSRRARADKWSDSLRERLRSTIDEAWPEFVHVNLDEHLAGGLAYRLGISGADAIHLAAGLTLAEAGERVGFCSFDLRLNRAAAAEGLHVMGPLPG
jgi:predicted nucleic acid-binding protein